MPAANLSAKSVLIIGHVFPEPDSSAAGMRMLQLIHFFLDREIRVHFVSDSSPGEHSVLPEHELLSSGTIQLNHDSFNRMLEELHPEFVLFDRFMTEEKFGWRVRETLPEVVQILDMEDFHALRKIRERENEILLNPEIGHFQHDFAWREIASILRCDLSLVISEFEFDLLRNLFNIPESQLILLPFWSDFIPDKQHLPSYETRLNFITIGNFLHPPNADSVLWLSREIWPKIYAQLPHAQMHVYGAYQNSQHAALHQPTQGFFMKSCAENAFELMQHARVCLAPLRYGAGLKGKLLLAMQACTPSITTSIGAEGMQGNLPWPGDVANDSDAIAQAALQLYNNRQKWMEASAACINTIQCNFDKVQCEYHLEFVLNNQLINFKKLRKSHFYKAMLSYSTLQSYKYMSKWIELKNKSQSIQPPK